MINRKPRNVYKSYDGKYGKSKSLEGVIAKQIEAAEGVVVYESLKISWIEPETKHTYTPDFVLANGVIIEAKGRFLLDDRKKHLWVKEQYPDLDIRFVFQNANTPIRKGAKTTYADWCTKHGFLFSQKVIPEEWFYAAK